MRQVANSHMHTCMPDTGSCMPVTVSTVRHTFNVQLKRKARGGMGGAGVMDETTGQGHMGQGFGQGFDNSGECVQPAPCFDPQCTGTSLHPHVCLFWGQITCEQANWLMYGFCVVERA